MTDEDEGDELTPELQEAMEIMARRAGLTPEQYMEVLLMLDAAGQIDHNLVLEISKLSPEIQQRGDQALLKNLLKDGVEDLTEI